MDKLLLISIRYIIALALVITSQAALSSDVDACKAQTIKSFTHCKTLADNGNIDGMFGLGLLYLDGKGVNQDFEEAYAWFLVAKENGSEYAQEGINYMDAKKLIRQDRMNAVTQRANDIYAGIKNKRGFDYGPGESSILVNNVREYCEMVMPTVGTVIAFRNHGKSRSDVQQLMVGMTDPRSIKMMEGVIDWVWSSKMPVSEMYNDFERKCLEQSPTVRFIFP